MMVVVMLVMMLMEMMMMNFGVYRPPRESIVSASLAVPTFAESADLAGWVCINV